MKENEIPNLEVTKKPLESKIPENSLTLKINNILRKGINYGIKSIFSQKNIETIQNLFTIFYRYIFKNISCRFNTVSNLDKPKYNFNVPLINETILVNIKNFYSNPLISIVMPVYNVNPKWLELAVASVKNQWYQNWELCICDDCSTNLETISYLKSIDNDSRIKIKYLNQNVNISDASNKAIAMATGDYIGFLDNDDELTADALYEVVKCINEKNAEFLYSDEDKINENNEFCEPHYKPDFCPLLFLNHNYICHFTVIKTELIHRVNGFTRGLEGAQDYDLFLKILEITDNIQHIEKVLYHWRKIPGSTATDIEGKPYASAAGKKALENALSRRKISGDVLYTDSSPFVYRIRRKLKEEPLISIIIPFKDQPQFLIDCIKSIIEKSTYPNFEIISISNNSEKLETFEAMEQLAKLDERIHFFEENIPFNFSKINNLAINKYSNGKFIITLNNDIKVITPEWIENLLELAQNDEVGIAGAKLLYPDGSIQHAGLGLLNHQPSHLFYKHAGNDGRFFTYTNTIREVFATTAACMIFRRADFDKISGFDETFSVDFNDIDFCLRLRKELSKSIIYTGYSILYHYENISLNRKEQNQTEVNLFNDRWGEALSRDKYFNLKLIFEN